MFKNFQDLNVIKEEDLENFYIFNFQSLTIKEIETLEKVFDEIKDKRMPSLYDQFEQKDPIRLKLDNTIMEVLGFQKDEIEFWIPKIYEVISKELRTMKRAT